MNSRKVKPESWLRWLTWLTWGLIALAGGLLGLGWAALPLGPRLRLVGLCSISFVVTLWVGSRLHSHLHLAEAQPWSPRWDRLRLPSAGLVGFVLLAAGELCLGLGPGRERALPVPALAVAVAFLGWELDLFLRRLQGAAQIELKLILHHLAASGLIFGVVLGLLLAGFYLHLTLSFGLALLLAVASFTSLVVILRLARS